MIDWLAQFDKEFGVGGLAGGSQSVPAQVEPLHDPTHTPTSRGLEGPVKEYDPPTPEEVAEAFQFKYGV